MPSLNKLQLIGHLGQDPEIKDINGKSLVSVSLATTNKYKDKETTTWHPLKIWGKSGEAFAKYTSKGSLVYIEGEVSYQKGKDDKYYYSVMVFDWKVMDGKKPKPSQDDDFFPEE